MNGDQHTRAESLYYFCALTIRKHLLMKRFERSGRGQEPSRGHKFSILENFLSIRDFTSTMRLHFRSDLVGACLPQTLLRTDEEELCQSDTIPPTIERNRALPSGGTPCVSCDMWYFSGCVRRAHPVFVLYKWLSSLRKPKRCCPRSGQTLQSRTRHCRQCGCRHAHRRSFRQRHTNRGSHSPAYQGPLRLC